MITSILVVDDNELVREAVRLCLERGGFEVEEAASGEEALELLSANAYPVLMIDMKMPGLSGMDVLNRLRAEYRKTEVIIMTGYATIDLAVEAIRNGAFDFITKPIDFDRAVITVRNACEKVNLQRQVETLATQIQKELDLENIIGSNLAMLNIFDTIRRISETDVNVLITGESGTGKEIIARALHRNSGRRKAQFIAVNCVALAENLLESELFGHERGAFTGAAGRKIGYFEAADGGTLFLDEIGDLPMPLQAKLLRTLQERTIQRVGSTGVIPVDVRIICATNKELPALIREGRFREDLFYRLNVLGLEIPPLRERKDDLPQLTHFFINKYMGRMGKENARLDSQTEEALMAYDWPGNVRELENVVQRAVALSENGSLTPDSLPPHILSAIKHKSRTASFLNISSYKEAKEYAINSFEKKYLSESLRRHKGNVTHAAESIGLCRTVMQRILKEHGIESRDFKKN